MKEKFNIDSALHLQKLQIGFIAINTFKKMNGHAQTEFAKINLGKLTPYFI